VRPSGDIDWLTARPIAHRGYHDARDGRLENTLPAFEAAIRRGFAIECDVRLSADGAVIVFHDETLDRLTESAGAVSRLSLAELRDARMRVGDAGIPALAELLDLVRGAVPLVVELKSEEAGTGAPLAAAVARQLTRYDGAVAVMSFEPPTMVAMRAIAPRLPRGMIVDAFAAKDHPQLSAAQRFALRHLLMAPSAGPRFIACDAKRLPALAPRALRAFGRPTLTWTVRSAAERQRVRPHADQIIFEGFDPDV
jgi:glycerophosphoryl diester phosphodiesterase